MLALTLKPCDRILDEMNAFTSDKLITRMSRDSNCLRSCLNLMFISRHLERAGDLATTIAKVMVMTCAKSLSIVCLQDRARFSRSS